MLDIFALARPGPPRHFSRHQILQISRTVRRVPLCVAPHNGAYVDKVLMWSDWRHGGFRTGIGLLLLHITSQAT
jgi:hypothetical protein